MSGPTKVVMDYHHEPEGWWADSDDLPVEVKTAFPTYTARLTGLPDPVVVPA